MTRQAEQTLRESGYRLTPQRVLVLDVLRRSPDEHLSADAICAEVQKLLPTFNVASVYRTLALLAELGLAKETRLADGPAVWEVAHDRDHHHLVCRVCGTITHHQEPVLSRVSDHLRQAHDFATEHADLVVTGVCGACRATRS
jgi:Fur family transcriptional regulator, ferric uptake regulator